MTIAIDVDDKHERVSPRADEGGAASRRIVAGYGFWIFLLSDIVMFSALFASYAVLAKATAGGLSGAQLFDRRTVAMETVFLLLSSYACGFLSFGMSSRRYLHVFSGAAVTFVLGVAFLSLEFHEFRDMIALGATPQRSAFLSGFFALVGCHGIHVTVGLIWLVIMMVQLAMWGFRPVVERRILCFALFWHALDIIWIMIFTVVYLMGVAHD